MSSSGWLWDDDSFPTKSDSKSTAKRNSSRSKQQANSKLHQSAQQKPGCSADHPLSVSEINQWISTVISSGLPKLWLKAEISDLSQAASGHIYLTLKDANSQIRAVVWRSTAQRLQYQLTDGLEVICQGKVDVYAPRGSYQLVLQSIRPEGVGELQLAFEQLHRKLNAEGLFAPDRKRPLTPFPDKIAVVTSPTGAAVRDFLEVVRRRWNRSVIQIFPTPVQGDGSVSKIINAIHMAHEVKPAPDVIVLTRGGGSMEDLWSFNSESLVRAVAASKIPIVSAIGHEIDVTLCDFAADVRALTPSEAAELVTPDEGEIRRLLIGTKRGIDHLILQKVRQFGERLDALRRRGPIAKPELAIERLRQRVDEIEHRTELAMARTLENKRDKAERLTSQIHALSPLGVLSRGFAILSANDQPVVSSVRRLEKGDAVTARVSDGTIRATVTEVSPE